MRNYRRRPGQEGAIVDLVLRRTVVTQQVYLWRFGCAKCETVVPQQLELYARVWLCRHIEVGCEICDITLSETSR